MAPLSITLPTEEGDYRQTQQRVTSSAATVGSAPKYSLSIHLIADELRFAGSYAPGCQLQLETIHHLPQAFETGAKKAPSRELLQPAKRNGKARTPSTGLSFQGGQPGQVPLNPRPPLSRRQQGLKRNEVRKNIIIKEKKNKTCLAPGKYFTLVSFWRLICVLYTLLQPVTYAHLSHRGFFI